MDHLDRGREGVVGGANAAGDVRGEEQLYGRAEIACRGSVLGDNWTSWGDRISIFRERRSEDAVGRVEVGPNRAEGEGGGPEFSVREGCRHDRPGLPGG